MSGRRSFGSLTLPCGGSEPRRRAVRSAPTQADIKRFDSRAPEGALEKGRARGVPVLGKGILRKPFPENDGRRETDPSGTPPRRKGYRVLRLTG